jgi:thiazole synthase
MFSPMADKPSKLKIADREFTSRLIVGTGKFASNELMRDALIASGTELVTVALRRADLSGKHDPFANILDFIDPKLFLLLPNTSGARNAAEAVRLARLAAAAGLPTWIKLEIHPDPRYLLPDPVETLAAAEILVKEGFTVLPYINADPVLAKRLQDVGTATVMPLGSPIGSNRNASTDRDHHRTGHSTGGCRCGTRRAKSGSRSDGDGRRCGAGQYGDCNRFRSCSHGKGI